LSDALREFAVTLKLLISIIACKKYLIYGKKKKKLILPCYLKPISSILVLVNKLVDINSWKRFSQIFCYDVSSWEKAQPLKLGVGKKYQTEQKKKTEP
jgi:hypothetical protein